eukprot:CAMPEP_0184693726 /NCGR_PEP_ID=MMETSP0313-20130426/1887_1 /TAXON_ID=2792 /ORGANISM="Porphyridium aerugineum, Strain SAG 1380-2" /LENGTH=620 /DNA_ID=CAMNT_0027151875 /DNA_START=33 /DNA_END=1895 /DNA_ORIENTATION=-
MTSHIRTGARYLTRLVAGTAVVTGCIFYIERKAETDIEWSDVVASKGGQLSILNQCKRYYYENRPFGFQVAYRSALACFRVLQVVPDIRQVIMYNQAYKLAREEEILRQGQSAANLPPWAIEVKLDPKVEDDMTKVHQRLSIHVAKTCDELGALYLKLAQAVSSLPGSFRKEYVDALLPLTDKANPSGVHHVRQLIERELGVPLEAVFSHFDEHPLGVASIAQVHAAKLVSDGRDVVVKVKHRYIDEQMKADLRLLRIMHSMAGRFMNPDKQVMNLLWHVLDQVERDIDKELDFAHEAKNATLSRVLLEEEQSMRHVVIPRIVTTWSTKNIITMDRIFGERIDEASKKLSQSERRQVADLLARCIAVMLLRAGFVHGDLHGGNVLLVNRNDPKEPFQISFLDHAIYRYLPPSQREQLRQVTSSMFSFPLRLQNFSAPSIADMKYTSQTQFLGFAFTMLVRPMNMKALMKDPEQRQKFRTQARDNFQNFISTLSIDEDNDTESLANNEKNHANVSIQPDIEKNEKKKKKNKQNRKVQTGLDGLLPPGDNYNPSHIEIVSLLRALALGHELHRRVRNDENLYRLERSLIYLYEACLASKDVQSNMLCSAEIMVVKWFLQRQM